MNTRLAKSLAEGAYSAGKAAANRLRLENSLLEVSAIEVADAHIPRAFSGLRIAQISDLHNTQFGPDNKILITLLRQVRPQLIVLTGDLVDSRRTDRAVAAAFAAAAAKIAPTFYVAGNHEARMPEVLRQLTREMQAAGVHVLRNQRALLRRGEDTLSLIGLDDPACRGFTRDADMADEVARQLHRLRQPGQYTIVLSHRPRWFPIYAAAGADLVFCGHMHGGQIRLPAAGGLLSPQPGLFPRYSGGLYHRGRAQMIVSRGLGNSLFPFRINNRPEVVLATLRHKPAAARLLSPLGQGGRRS